MKQPPLFTDAFEDFWQLYPRRQAKLDARKAWSKLNPSLELVQAILAAVEVQRRSQEWRKDGGQWVPLPALRLSVFQTPSRTRIVAARPLQTEAI